MADPSITLRDPKQPSVGNKPVVRRDDGPKTTIGVSVDTKVDTKTVQEVKQGDIKILKPKAPSEWLMSLYSVDLVSSDELADWYNSFRYAAFDRDLMLAKLFERAADPKLAAQVVILCALRGPQAASKVKLKNGKTPSELGIPASGQMGSENLSCQRVTAATADLAAFYLKRFDSPKRLPLLECPGWLQFPSAASIKMPDYYRRMHTQFMQEFSVRIGGVFREDILSNQIANAYLDENLHLFD